ncbi:retrovirus-related pol polyprotein from transposon TNT 1-94 [Tanacetum coccineum]
MKFCRQLKKENKKKNYNNQKNKHKKDDDGDDNNDDMTELWHKRLGHMSEKGMSILSKNNVLSSIAWNSASKDSTEDTAIEWLGRADE